MTKLSNGIEYTNEFFKPEFAEYLLSNGFVCTRINALYIDFTRDMHSILIGPFSIQLFQNKERVWNAGKTATVPDQWQIFEWMLLLHLYKVLTIQEFIKNAEAIDYQIGTEARMVTRSMLHVLTGGRERKGPINEDDTRPERSAYAWVYRIIESCTAEVHLAIAENVAMTYLVRYPDEIQYNAEIKKAFDAVKEKILKVQQSKKAKSGKGATANRVQISNQFLNNKSSQRWK